MTILDQILATKREEVKNRKELYPVKLLEKSIYFPSAIVSLKKYLKRPDLFGIIAEVKRKSPSKGFINKHINVEELSIGYMQAGASALSILTDETYFGGTAADLTIARKFNFCPLLRKDFTIDEYQIIEAKSIGADAILLIAKAISPEDVKKFTEVAHKLGLEVLLEVHSVDEFKSHYYEAIDVIGVNNRDLRDFSVDIARSIEISKHIPSGAIRISESGIDDAQTIKKLKQVGFDGFLIGEAFMKTSKPERACATLISSLKEN